MSTNMDNFEQHLMQKYPGLFYKNDSGELECPCGAWVPAGWHSIVDDLCGAIMHYSTHTSSNSKKITSSMYYFWNACANLFDWIHMKFIKMFPKYNEREYNKLFFLLINKLRVRSYQHTALNKIFPPAVKIDQIKEKFGGLRFYYTGGDKQIAGMVHMAEYLCDKTCEVTGGAGVLCSRNGWYRTLSPQLIEQHAYKDYKPIK